MPTSDTSHRPCVACGALDDTSNATTATLIRPADGRALLALRRLAREGAAHLQRGTISLADHQRPALLVIAPTGSVIAAVLLDTAESDRGSFAHSDCTETPVDAQFGAQGVTSNDHG